MAGKSGPVTPDLISQILIKSEADLLLLKRLFQPASQSGIHHTAVKAQGLALFHVLLQILLNGGNPFVQHAEQFDSRTGKFVFRLDEIPAVRPQTGFLLTHHQRSVGSGKTGKILPHLKIPVHILGIVEICGGHHIIINPRLLHHFLKRRNALLNHLIHFLLFPAACKAALYF